MVSIKWTEKSDSRCSRTTKLEFPHTLLQLSKETRILKNKCRIIANQTQPERKMIVTSLPMWSSLMGRPRQTGVPSSHFLQHPSIFQDDCTFFLSLHYLSCHRYTVASILQHLLCKCISWRNQIFFQRQLITSYRLYSRTCSSRRTKWNTWI